MIGAGLTFMEMKRQRHMHDRLNSMRFRLAERSGWTAETFSVYDTGYHTLFLTTVKAFSKPVKGDTMNEIQTRYRGEFEVRMIDPSDSVIWSKRIDGDSISLQNPANVSWTFLDSIRIGNPVGGSWKLQVRVWEADNNFSKTYSELALMPPMGLDIGRYIYGESIKLIGMGIALVVGFCLMVLGGYLRRRSTRPDLHSAR